MKKTIIYIFFLVFGALFIFFAYSKLNPLISIRPFSIETSRGEERDESSQHAAPAISNKDQLQLLLDTERIKYKDVKPIKSDLTNDDLKFLAEKLRSDKCDERWANTIAVIAYGYDSDEAASILINCIDQPYNDIEIIIQDEFENTILGTLAKLGLVDSKLSRDYLTKAFTIEGATAISQNYDSAPSLQNHLRRLAPDFIRGFAARGLIHTGNEECLKLIDDLFLQMRVRIKEHPKFKQDINTAILEVLKDMNCDGEFFAQFVDTLVHKSVMSRYKSVDDYMENYDTSEVGRDFGMLLPEFDLRNPELYKFSDQK